MPRLRPRSSFDCLFELVGNLDDDQIHGLLQELNHTCEGNIKVAKSVDLFEKADLHNHGARRIVSDTAATGPKPATARHYAPCSLRMSRLPMARSQTDMLAPVSTYGYSHMFHTPPEQQRAFAREKEESISRLPSLDFDSPPGSPRSSEFLTSPAQSLSSSPAKPPNAPPSVNQEPAAPSVIRPRSASSLSSQLRYHAPPSPPFARPQSSERTEEPLQATSACGCTTSVGFGNARRAYKRISRPSLPADHDLHTLLSAFGWAGRGTVSSSIAVSAQRDCDEQNIEIEPPSRDYVFSRAATVPGTGPVVGTNKRAAIAARKQHVCSIAEVLGSSK